MKTQQEIVVKAKEYAESIGSKDGTCMYDFAMGYTKCQKDMIKLLEFEINKAFIHGQENAQKMEAGLERDEVKDYTNSRIRILNKQD